MSKKIVFGPKFFKEPIGTITLSFGKKDFIELSIDGPIGTCNLRSVTNSVQHSHTFPLKKLKQLILDVEGAVFDE